MVGGNWTISRVASHQKGHVSDVTSTALPALQGLPAALLIFLLYRVVSPLVMG